MKTCFLYVIKASTEMARAETIETLGETGGRGNGPLSHHSTCCMELPRPFHSWHGLPTTITTGSATSTGPMHPCHNHSHNLQPLQALYVSYTQPYSPPESQDEPQTHQQLPTLSPSLSLPLSPLCNQREEVDAGFSGEQSGKIMFFLMEPNQNSAAWVHTSGFKVTSQCRQ